MSRREGEAGQREREPGCLRGAKSNSFFHPTPARESVGVKVCECKQERGKKRGDHSECSSGKKGAKQTEPTLRSIYRARPEGGGLGRWKGGRKEEGE